EPPNVAPQFQDYELVSAGPDGKFGTEDDVKLGQPKDWQLAHGWNWFGLDPNMDLGGNNLGWATRWGGGFQGGFGGGFGGRGEMFFGMRGAGGGMMPGMPAGGLMPMAPAAPANLAVLAREQLLEKAASKADVADNKGAGAGEGGAAPVLRVREYFPETMF